MAYITERKGFKVGDTITIKYVVVGFYDDDGISSADMAIVKELNSNRRHTVEIKSLEAVNK